RPMYSDHGVGDAIDPSLDLGVSKAELSHRNRDANDSPRQVLAGASMVLGTLFLRYGNVLFFEDSDLFVQLGHVIDFAGEVVQAVLKDFVSNLFFVEGDHFLDRANA